VPILALSYHFLCAAASIKVSAYIFKRTKTMSNNHYKNERIFLTFNDSIRLYIVLAFTCIKSKILFNQNFFIRIKFKYC